MPSRLLAAALLAAALPQLVLARPAVVRVFEAPARAEPSPDAPVMQLLLEKAELSVSEEPQGGWWRVRLQDGRTGWVEGSALAFPAESAAAPAPRPVPAELAPSPDLRPRIYVKDLSHLAELVKGDATISPRAEALAKRRSTAIGIWVVGGIAALALAGASAARQMPDPGEPGFDSTLDGKMRMLMGGVALGLGAGVLGLAIHPRRGELLDVVNGWNTGHPDQQFELVHGEVGQR